jgi:hypothetical protein
MIDNTLFNNYEIINGLIYNITNITNIIKLFNNLDSYGKNTTVNYLGGIYPNLTTFTNFIPIIEEVYPDDYILFEINTSLIKEQNILKILNFTNYSFEINENGVKTNTYGSVDQTIQFFDKLKQDEVVKICVCTSKIIAEKYKNQGYIISKVSLNLLKISSFNYLFRVGFDNSNFINPSLIDVISTKYYRSKNKDAISPEEYYYKPIEIINSWPTPYLPLNNDIYKSVQENFQNLKDFISINPKIVLKSPFYPYLSNFYNTNYAFQNIYDALTVNPPAQLQANDTGKSYYLTNYIDFSNYLEGYLYIIALNHNASNVCITSNIQIYETTNFDAINNGSVFTGPDYPNLDIPYYPIPSIINNTIPTYNIFCYSCKNLNDKGVNKVIIAERLQYSLANFYHPLNNLYPGTGCCYIFNEPLTVELEYLKEKYNIDVQYVVVK